MTLTLNHPVRHVFVLMLENRSFDHLFAFSGIPGITRATAANSNPFPGGQAIPFGPGAPEVMPTDPGHEFDQVVEQLCGPGVTFPQSHAYPPIDNQGFAASYAATFKHGATRDDAAQIMAGIASSRQTPALHALATNYVLCDHWFSSLPGPTWPNRFFVHGASSSGLDHSPSFPDIAIWEKFAGFVYPNGSVYDRLGSANYRLYQDKSGPLSGQVPQVAALKGIHGGDVRDVDQLAADLGGTYPCAYTFIEPAYGDLLGNSYQRGSSQHPRDGLAAGDRLVARVYNAIRQSPLWSQSVLIITYDEHGGFYDSVSPPAAPAPGDHPRVGHNKFGFDFTRYGVRVPSIVVSPFVAKGGVDHEWRDHASIIATLSGLFGIAPLTERDRHANSLMSLFGASPRSDADCPASITGAAAPAPLPARDFVPAFAPIEDLEPVPDGSNLQAFLFVVRKTHAEKSGTARVEAPAVAFDLVVTAPPPTIGEARRYIEQMVPALFNAKERDP